MEIAIQLDFISTIRVKNGLSKARQIYIHTCVQTKEQLNLMANEIK